MCCVDAVGIQRVIIPPWCRKFLLKYLQVKNILEWLNLSLVDSGVGLEFVQKSI